MATAELSKPIDAAPTVTADQLDLIRRTIAKDATPDELKLYLYDCARQGVHPLDKLIHFTTRSGKYTPVTSIDFMRTRAADTGEYAGSDDARFDWLVDGESLRPNVDAPPRAATVTVWRLVQGIRCPFTATARWAEYKPESNDFMWRKMPHTMLAKCAEALALRKGFPRQLSGLYAKEELDQAGNGGLVVEAPAGPVAAIPPAPNGDPARTPSVPNGGDLGRSRPAGAVLVRHVSTGHGKAKGFVELDPSSVPAGKGYAVYDERLKTLAEELCQNGEYVTPKFKTAASGQDYLIGLERMTFKVEPADQPEPPPLTDDDLAF